MRCVLYHIVPATPATTPALTPAPTPAPTPTPTPAPTPAPTEPPITELGFEVKSRKKADKKKKLTSVDIVNKFETDIEVNRVQVFVQDGTEDRNLRGKRTQCNINFVMCMLCIIPM